MCQALNVCCYKQELTHLKKKVNRIITPQPRITQLTQLFMLIRFTSIYFVNIFLITLPASLNNAIEGCINKIHFIFWYSW